MQWTYEAMVHEQFGINNQRVDLSSLGDAINPELRQIVLSPLHDDFFRQVSHNTIYVLFAYYYAYCRALQLCPLDFFINFKNVYFHELPIINIELGY